MMKTAGKVILGFVVVLMIAVGGIVYFHLNTRAGEYSDQPAEITGSVEVKSVDVNVKVPGKVEKFLVEEGDTVEAGQVIATVEAANIEAKSDLTQATVEAAIAQYQKAKNGARPQQVEQAKSLVEQAKVACDFTETTYNRLAGLYKEGVLPRQKLDQAKTELDVARARLRSAREQCDMVQEGAQREDIEAAAALVKQAQAAKSEVQTYLDDAKVKAPVAGIITMKAVEDGELVSTGMPLVTISNLKDAWVEMKVRETMLNRFNLGDTVPVKIIGAPGKVYQGKVTYIAAKSSFATERSYQERGEKDLVAFGVKIKLENEDRQLKPGMTAVISLQNRQSQPSRTK
jgi:HlyD family secretion protein